MLSCKGVGVPPPSISWSRKNGSALPKNAKVYSNGSLFLRDIKLEDQGDYICTATNDAGTIHTEITIKVYGKCTEQGYGETVLLKSHKECDMCFSASFTNKQLKQLKNASFRANVSQ